MVDIYEDLENFDFGEEVEKLRSENRVLLDKISELEEENKVLTQKNTVIEKEVKELRTNISSLLKTSTAEIQRKDKTIAELRERENNVPIRLPKPFLKHNLINKKPAELQGRQPEKSHFGIFKQAGFPPQKGPTNRTTCQPINEERKQPENSSRNLPNLQQESTSISFASELGNALPVKDTQKDLFGIGQRYENSQTFHNYAKTGSFGANETSQNDSLQKSIKAELDQTSSQLFDKVLERRLRQTQMEFEKDYSEVENLLHSKPFENKTSHKSPTRKCTSPRNKRDDYKRSISQHRSRSRSNEQIKRNIIVRSRSPLRRPDHKGFHQGRSNSRDRKNNFHDNSSFQGRSGKHDRYNEKGRRETDRHFSRNIDRLRLDRREHYNDSSRKLSEERRRESNASGDSNRSSKHGHESGRKPSPVRSSKCISKASLDDRLRIRKEKYDETHIPRKKIKLENNSPHHEVHKKSDSSSTDKQEILSQSTDYNIEEGEIQEQQTINDAKKTACVPIHNTAKNDNNLSVKGRLREAKEMPDRIRSVKVDSPIIHHGLKQTKPDDEPNTHFNDEMHIPRKKITLGNNSPHHKVHKTSDLGATDKQENLSQSTDYNIEEGEIQEQQTINDAKKTACVPIHNTAKNDNLSVKGRLREAKEMPDRIHSVKVDSPIIHHGLKQTKPDDEPNAHFNDETHIPRQKIKLENNSPHHKVHKTSDLSATDKQENLSQSTDSNIEEGEIEEQQTINDAKKTACVPIHNTAMNDNLSAKGRLREAREMPDRIHSVKEDSPITHHGLKPTETDGDPNTHFNNEMNIPRNKIKLENNSPHHEVHKSSELSSTDKQGNFSQPTDYNIEEGEIQGRQAIKDANKTACVSVHNTAKNENPNIKLYSREAKEMSDITHSVKVVDSSIIHHGLKPTEPDGDSKTPSMTLTDNCTDSNSYSVKITKRPRRNIKYYFTDDGDSKETALTIPQVKAPVLITKESSENIYAINKPSVSSRHDTKDVKKHLVQPEMKGDISMPNKHLEPDGNKSESSVSKLHHEKSESISETVPQINLEKSATKSETSSKNSPEKSDLKCHTSVPKYHSEKHSANPEKSELKCNSLITKNKLSRYDLFGDCSESDSKCNLFENNPEVEMEVVDTWVAKSNPDKLDSPHSNHTFNQLRKSDLKCYTRKSKINLENSFTSKHTHADNLESNSAKHHHEKSGTNESKSQIENLDTKYDSSKHKHHEKSDSNESKSHIENLDTKYDTSKHKHHEKSDTTKPKTHVEISDSKCDKNKSIHRVEKSDSNVENLDLNCETSKNKSHVEKSESSKSKTHLNNSKSDSSKTKIQLEKCDIGVTDIEKSDTDKSKIHLEKTESKCDAHKIKIIVEKSEASKPKIHLENSNLKSDFSKPKTFIEKCETSKHKSYLEKSDHSKTKTHIDNSESKHDSSKTKTHIDSSESKSDSSKTKTHLDNLDSKHDSIKTKTHLEKYDTGKATNNIEKSDTNKPKTHLEKSDSKCDNSKTRIILEKSDSRKPKIHLENSNSESDSSKPKTHIENSESKSDTSKHKNHIEKSNTSKPKTHQDNSEAKCDSTKSIKQLDKTNSKCKSKKHIEKYDLFGETSEYDINSRKTDLFGEISNPKTKTDSKNVTSVSKNSEGKSDIKCEFSKVKNNTDKSDTTLPKSVLKSDACKTTNNLDKPNTTVSKSFSKIETSNTAIGLQKSDNNEPKSVPKRDTSNTTIDLDKIDTIMPKLVPKGDTSNATVDLDTTMPKLVPKGDTSNTTIVLDKSDPTMPKLVPKGDTGNAIADVDTTFPKLVPKGDTSNTTIVLDKSDTTMPKSVSKSVTSKIATDLERSNEKHILSEFKQIEEKPVVKCETNSSACVRKTCVTPISENTLHVKIFRRNTIIKKSSN